MKGHALVDHHDSAGLVEGLSQKEIADQMAVSFHTVDMHLRNIGRKLQVHTAAAAVAKAVRERIR